MAQAFRFEDFIVESPIGQGAYGQIYKAQFVKTGEIFALKALNRRVLLKMKKQSVATVEKEALNKCSGGFIIDLYGTFKDTSNLYFVLRYAQHGDLAEAVHDLGSLNIMATKYTCAQLLVAISTMHQQHIIHRDIKIENILLDERNYIMLTDFGTALICDNNDPGFRSSSIVGTPAFVAPELLNDGKICYASDLWAFGCVIFNLLTGKAPFEGENVPALMANIVSRKIVPEMERLPKHAKSLILSLLEVDPQKRIGYGESETGYPSIRNHPFFNHVVWETLGEITMPLFSSFEPETETSFAKELIEPGESIIHEGKVERKRFLSWKERLMIITDRKRIMLFNLEKKSIKHTIPISPKLKIHVEPDGKEWSITFNDKTEKYRCKDGNAGLWASKIMKEMTPAR